MRSRRPRARRPSATTSARQAASACCARARLGARRDHGAGRGASRCTVGDRPRQPAPSGRPHPRLPRGCASRSRGGGPGCWRRAGLLPCPPSATSNPTCEPFEPVRCDCFITEATFGLPIYRWPRHADVFADMNAWWQANAEAGEASVVGAYSLGKTQHVLAGIEASIGPVYVHPAAEAVSAAHVAEGVALPATRAWKPRAGGRALAARRPGRHAPERAGAVALAARGARARVVRQRLDAAAWRASPDGARSRLRAERPRRLARFAGGRRCDELRSGDRTGDEAVLARALAEQGLQCGSFGTSFGEAPAA